MKSLVFGGSAGVGRELCRALAARGDEVTIIARNADDLRAESAHCTLSTGAKVNWIAIDASDSFVVESALLAHLSASQSTFDNLLFPIGAVADYDHVDSRADSLVRAVQVNLMSIMVAISALLPYMTDAGPRNIIGFGSIAAIRGRRSNVSYAAAKRGLESYFESLRHSLTTRGIFVQFYRLGYIETQQSFGKRLMLPSMTAEAVAQHVVSHMNRDIGTRSLPRYWAAIAAILKTVPWIIFRRLDF